MASPEVLDFTSLLAPIPGEKPGGESVRYAGVYDSIQEARREEDDTEQGEWKRDTKKADWNAVINQSSETLSAKSKDLQVAAWLAEAVMRRHGFPGLRDGLRLMRELQEQFWDHLYPEVEDGDLEYRAAPFWWLNEKLPLAVRNIPLIRTPEVEYALWHWDESRSVEKLARVDPQAHAAAVADGKVTGEKFNTAAMAPARAYYEALFTDVSETLDECTRLQQVADERFGRDAPSLLGLKKTIEECRNLIEPILKKKRELEPDPVLDAQIAGEAAPASGDGAARRAGGGLPTEPVDRADALARLAVVADFFRRTEPHSPVAYLVQRAVRWGQMPLEQWLQEVIVDNNVLNNVRETLGLKDAPK
jgi:type VI secretion system protein ImpA